MSLARNIGYVPRSRKASTAQVSFDVDVSNTTAVSVTLKAGAVMTSRSTGVNKSRNFIFSIPNDITVPVDSTGTASFRNINIYEGTYIKQTFTVDGSNKLQKFILPNSGIDTDLLNVVVRDTQSSTVTRQFELFTSLFDVTKSTRAYFLQEISQERYELLFGDGVFGVKLEDKNYIEASYITSNGASGNNIANFQFIGNLNDNNGAGISSGVSIIETVLQSTGGKSIESVESIKKYAPQIYASQNRAVTAADYEALIPQIYPEAESVSAFGGEDLSPPQFGKVFISVKPYNGVFLSSGIKQNLQQRIKSYSVAGIRAEIIDLKYLYVEADCETYYNTNLAPNASFVQNVVLQNLTAYADSSELNQFGARFKYSKFQKVIDSSHQSVTSNITNVNMRRDMVASPNKFAEYELCFGNRFHVKNHGHSAVFDGNLVGYNIKSSGFTVSGISGTVYLGDKPTGDLEKGTVFLFKLNSPTEPIIVKQNVGTIDYKKGEIKLNPINIISTIVNRNTPLVEVSATPYSNDVIGLQDLYLQLDVNNTTVDVIADNISSGNDVSGTNYIVSSSYGSNALVRGTPITTVETPEQEQALLTTTPRQPLGTAIVSRASY
ncbi:baseplate wedge subunit [Synechococcus phage S-B05]|nr:baseplate wedge subunit [Synechococcus phage S-B05]